MSFKINEDGFFKEMWSINKKKELVYPFIKYKKRIPK